MADNPSTFQVHPGRGLGWITLGASIHGILTGLKSHPQIYPQLDLSYSAAEPLLDPIVLTLPKNGLRLRFDGPDQRLRLIEILDFSHFIFTYRSMEFVRKQSNTDEATLDPVTGPTFKHIYNRLLGPSYAGEYVPPQDGQPDGTYVLSYPGLAARFPVKHRSWSPKANFVTLLSSSATGPATSVAIFQGQSWPEARRKLYTQKPHLPRSLGLGAKANESMADDVEEVIIHPFGKLELLRQNSPPFHISLHETTPQDLVAQLGPPDAIYRKPSNKISIHADDAAVRYRASNASPSLDAQSSDHEGASNRSYTDDSEHDGDQTSERIRDDAEAEVFYNYFHHGFDVLISSPATRASRPSSRSNDKIYATAAEYVATKIFLHGNIPGSYSFNRHRRIRWRIHLQNESSDKDLTSEMRFGEISNTLKSVWQDSYADAEEAERMQRGMVLNRGWDESPGSSIELLGGFEEGPSAKPTGDAGDALPSTNNTELFGFPGLLFEVLKNGLVSCLTVYQ